MGMSGLWDGGECTIKSDHENGKSCLVERCFFLPRQLFFCLLYSHAGDDAKGVEKEAKKSLTAYEDAPKRLRIPMKALRKVFETA